VASPRARSSDIKLIVSATVAVLLAGFLIAGGILVATRGSGSVACGQLNLGSATDIRKNLQDGGPSFNSSGANCGFWLALDNTDMPTASPSSSSAASATSSAVWTRPVYTTSNPASRRARAITLAPRSCPSSPGLAMTTR
jgi:hypothetical protein